MITRFIPNFNEKFWFIYFKRDICPLMYTECIFLLLYKYKYKFILIYVLKLWVESFTSIINNIFIIELNSQLGNMYY